MFYESYLIIIMVEKLEVKEVGLRARVCTCGRDHGHDLECGKEHYAQVDHKIPWENVYINNKLINTA